MTDRPHHRPALPGTLHFESVEGGPDPALLSEAADRVAVALVRGAGSRPASGTPSDSAAIDEDLVGRIVRLAESEGLETLAQLWASAPADSIAGSLWRLYLLRSWVYAAPHQAAREFDAGRALTPVAEAVAGVAEPPGPDQVRRLVDDVLAGVVRGDYADVLFRAAAFARVAASGRARTDSVDGSSYAGDLSASRLLSLAQQLEHAGHRELDGRLG